MASSPKSLSRVTKMQRCLCAVARIASPGSSSQSPDQTTSCPAARISGIAPPHTQVSRSNLIHRPPPAAVQHVRGPRRPNRRECPRVPATGSPQVWSQDHRPPPAPSTHAQRPDDDLEPPVCRRKYLARRISGSGDLPHSRSYAPLDSTPAETIRRRSHRFRAVWAFWLKMVRLRVGKASCRIGVCSAYPTGGHP